MIMSKYCLIKERNGLGKIVVLDTISRRELIEKMSGGTISRVGIAYDTEEALREAERIPDEPCKCCGGVFGTNYSMVGAKLRELGLCFECNFWISVSEGKELERGIVIDGKRYTVGPETEGSGGYRGYGGRKFTIQLSTGEVITTTNLWCQGDIPERFRNILPDNAKFIRDE